MSEVNNPLDVQVGGNHYKNLKYQPVELSCKTCLNFIQGNIIKYITRYKSKNGKQDLEKVVHYAQLGSNLEPCNFYDTVFDEEVEKFIAENGIYLNVADIIFDVCCQDWNKVITKCNLLIEKEYAY